MHTNIRPVLWHFNTISGQRTSDDENVGIRLTLLSLTVFGKK